MEPGTRLCRYRTCGLTEKYVALELFAEVAIDDQCSLAKS